MASVVSDGNKFKVRAAATTSARSSVVDLREAGTSRAVDEDDRSRLQYVNSHWTDDIAQV
jgi:hypothetical protein